MRAASPRRVQSSIREVKVTEKTLLQFRYKGLAIRR
jgi:hypothetical protein